VSTPVLLVATATQWFGTARIPRSLTRAGFEVFLLAPKDTLAENSRFIARTQHLPDNATLRQWVDAFADIVELTSPRLVLPCDDTAFRLLQTLALSPPGGMRPESHLQLAGLIADSMGDTRFYRTSVEKTLLPPAAEALGIRVPRYAVIDTAAAAQSFAATHGYPIVLKRDHSTAGEGVAIVESSAELAAAFERLARPDPSALAPASPSGAVLIQVLVEGDVHYENTAAWNGRRIGGFAVHRLEYADDVKGPAAVIRCYRSDEIGDFSSRLVHGFGMTGLFATEYIVERTSGRAYLLEVNRRMTPGLHVGSRIGVDLCAALHAAMHGLAPTTRADMDEGEEHLNVHFPQEWLRDPRSSYLRNHPVDMPWDEPELIKAMLARRPKS
jgi:predicted ATP-grasp superfamily ATP-dependent carboligase